MIILVLLMTFAWHGAGAVPISAGPTTVPTIIHTIVYGIHEQRSCSDIRSMYDILRSCLFTIAACVYRAVHPNIPDPNASIWKRSIGMIKIVIYALIAPELIIWWAMRQRFRAKVVAEQVNGLKPELKWTQTHGQFAQMGGFGRKDSKRVLYPSTLIALLESDRIDVEELQLTEKEINDKSKGDILSKGLVAFQTTWFVFECLARLQQGLPLIELEVVTLAFATLNAITYGLWWHKPLNVICPIYLHIRPIRPPPSAVPDPPPQTDAVPVTQLEEGPFVREQSTAGESEDAEVGEHTQGTPVVQGLLDTVVTSFTEMGNAVKKDIDRKGYWWSAWRWLVKEPFLTVTGPLKQLLRDEEVDDEATHVSTFYAMKIPDKRIDFITILSSFIGMIFGAIHFLSWDSKFPTHTQLILWRTSSIVLVVQPLLILLADLCDVFYEHAPSGSILERVIEFWNMIFTYLSLLGGVIPYILARFCVLVLAFLTLRDLPQPAFTNVSWVSYIPHF